MVFVRSLLQLPLTPGQLYDAFSISSSRIRLSCSRQRSSCSACEYACHVVKVSLSESDRSICDHSLAIWERAWLPCSIAIIAWLVNIAFYIRSKFYDRSTCFREVHPDFTRTDMTWVLHSQTLEPRLY